VRLPRPAGVSRCQARKTRVGAGRCRV
jgi:hypothetical protein